MYTYVYLETMIILAHDSSKKLVTFFLVGIFSQQLTKRLLWEEHGRAPWVPAMFSIAAMAFDTFDVRQAHHLHTKTFTVLQSMVSN